MIQIGLPHRKILESFVEYVSIRLIQGNSVSVLRHLDWLRAIHFPVSRTWPEKVWVRVLFGYIVMICFFPTYFKINHFSGLWSFRTVAGVKHGNAVLFYFLFQVAQFTFHLIAASHLVYEFPLKGIDIRIKL